VKQTLVKQLKYACHFVVVYKSLVLWNRLQSLLSFWLAVEGHICCIHSFISHSIDLIQMWIGLQTELKWDVSEELKRVGTSNSWFNLMQQKIHRVSQAPQSHRILCSWHWQTALILYLCTGTTNYVYGSSHTHSGLPRRAGRRGQSRQSAIWWRQTERGS